MVMNLWKTSKFLLSTALSAMVLSISLAATAQIQLLDKVIAIVDDDVVLQSELDLRMTAVYGQIQQSGTQPPPQEILLQQVLDRLISERLQLNMAYSAGVRIGDEELNLALARIAAGNKITMEQYDVTLSDFKTDVELESVLLRSNAFHKTMEIHKQSCFECIQLLVEIINL